MSDYSEIKKVKDFIANRIPYCELLNFPDKTHKTIVQNTNGRIFSVFRLYAKDNRMNTEILDNRSQSLSDMLSVFLDSHWELTFDFIRTKQKYPLKCPKLDKNCVNAQELLNKRYEYFTKNDFFENITYFSLCYTFPTDSEKLNILTTTHLNNFIEKRETIKNCLLSSGFEVFLLEEDALVTYLYNGFINDFANNRKLINPSAYLNEYFAASTDVYPNIRPLVINDKIIRCVNVSALPKVSDSDFLNAVATFDGEIRLFMKFSCRSYEEAEKILYSRKEKIGANIFRPRAFLSSQMVGGKLQMSEDEIDYKSVSIKTETEDAIKHMITDSQSGGYLKITFMLSKNIDDERGLEAQYLNLQTVLHSIGLITNENDFTNTKNYFDTVMIGTGKKEVDGSFFILTDNFADYIPVSPSALRYSSPHLKNITHSPVPHIVGKVLKNSSYYYLSLCGTENSGHTFLTGGTGAGKSVTLGLLANEWLKYKNTKVVSMDIGLSMYKTARDNGAKIFYPKVDKTCFSPLKNAKDHIPEIMNFFEAIAIANEITLTTEDTLSATEILKKNMPYGHEKLEIFYQLFKGRNPDSAFTAVLEKYIKVYGDIFNAEDDSFTEIPRFCYVELSKLLEDQKPVLTYPTLVYLFNKFEQSFRDDEPTLLELDEVWLMFKNKFFVEYIEKWLRTLRKKNVFVVLATQVVADLVDNPITPIIMANTETQIFLRNKDADTITGREAYSCLGLMDYEVDLITDDNNIGSTSSFLVQTALQEQHKVVVRQNGTINVVSFCIGDEQIPYLKKIDNLTDSDILADQEKRRKK